MTTSELWARIISGAIVIGAVWYTIWALTTRMSEIQDAQAFYEIIVDSAPQATQANTEITLELIRAIGRALLVNVAAGLTAWWIMAAFGGRPRPAAEPIDTGAQSTTGTDAAPSTPDHTPTDDDDPGPGLVAPTTSASVASPTAPLVDRPLPD
jgi:hypothetical protein